MEIALCVFRNQWLCAGLLAYYRQSGGALVESNHRHLKFKMSESKARTRRTGQTGNASNDRHLTAKYKGQSTGSLIGPMLIYYVVLILFL